MKENQERAEVERNRNLRYGGNTGNSTELNDFLSDDKGQGSQERYPVPFKLKLNFRDPFQNYEEINLFHNRDGKQRSSKRPFGHKFSPRTAKQ